MLEPKSHANKIMALLIAMTMLVNMLMFNGLYSDTKGNLLPWLKLPPNLSNELDVNFLIATAKLPRARSIVAGVVTGNVMYTDNIGITRELSENVELAQHYSVTTAEGSFAQILIDDDIELFLDENTSVVISTLLVNGATSERGYETVLTLANGNLLSNITQKLQGSDLFEVRTPLASMSVRGTIVNVGYNKNSGESVIGFYEGFGAITTASGEKIELTESQQLAFNDVGAYGDIMKVETPTFVREALEQHTRYPETINFTEIESKIEAAFNDEASSSSVREEDTNSEQELTDIDASSQDNSTEESKEETAENIATDEESALDEYNNAESKSHETEFTESPISNDETNSADTEKFSDSAPFQTPEPIGINTLDVASVTPNEIVNVPEREAAASESTSEQVSQPENLISPMNAAMPDTQETAPAKETPVEEQTIEPTPELDPISELTVEPTIQPTVEPTVKPIVQSTVEPLIQPTVEPTIEPLIEPTVEPTIEPLIEPTIEPTIEPLIEPTVEPTVEPLIEPTVEPTLNPTPNPQKVKDFEVLSNLLEALNSYNVSNRNNHAYQAIVNAWSDAYLIIGDSLGSLDSLGAKNNGQLSKNFDSIYSVVKDMADEAKAGIEPTDPNPTAQPTVTPTIEPTVNPSIKPTVEPTLQPTPNPQTGMNLETLNNLLEALNAYNDSGRNNRAYQTIVDAWDAAYAIIGDSLGSLDSLGAKNNGQLSKNFDSIYSVVKDMADEAKAGIEPTDPDPTAEPTVVPTAVPTVEPTLQPTPNPQTGMNLETLNNLLEALNAYNDSGRNNRAYQTIVDAWDAAYAIIGDSLGSLDSLGAKNNGQLSKNFDSIYSVVKDMADEAKAGIEPTDPNPTAQPTVTPTIEPTVNPSIKPTVEPTLQPTPNPQTGMNLETLNNLLEALNAYNDSGRNNRAYQTIVDAWDAAYAIIGDSLGSLDSLGAKNNGQLSKNFDSIYSVVKDMADEAMAGIELTDPNPTAQPTIEPTAVPTAVPTAAPTVEPTLNPTPNPQTVMNLEALNNLLDALNAYNNNGRNNHAYQSIVDSWNAAYAIIGDSLGSLDSLGAKNNGQLSKHFDSIYSVVKDMADEAKAGIEPTDPIPTAEPTVVPTVVPTTEPTAVPTVEPTVEPTLNPTPNPQTVMNLEALNNLLDALNAYNDNGRNNHAYQSIVDSWNAAYAIIGDSLGSLDSLGAKNNGQLSKHFDSIYSVVNDMADEAKAGIEPTDPIPTAEPTVVPTAVPTTEPTVEPTVEPSQIPGQQPNIAAHASQASMNTYQLLDESGELTLLQVASQEDGMLGSDEEITPDVQEQAEETPSEADVLGQSEDEESPEADVLDQSEDEESPKADVLDQFKDEESPEADISNTAGEVGSNPLEPVIEPDFEQADPLHDEESEKNSTDALAITDIIAEGKREQEDDPNLIDPDLRVDGE